MRIPPPPQDIRLSRSRPPAMGGRGVENVGRQHRAELGGVGWGECRSMVWGTRRLPRCLTSSVILSVAEGHS